MKCQWVWLNRIIVRTRNPKELIVMWWIAQFIISSTLWGLLTCQQNPSVTVLKCTWIILIFFFLYFFFPLTSVVRARGMVCNILLICIFLESPYNDYAHSWCEKAIQSEICLSRLLVYQDYAIIVINNGKEVYGKCLAQGSSFIKTFNYYLNNSVRSKRLPSWVTALV